MNGEAKINHQKWREIILFAIDKLDPVLRRIQEEILYPFFAKADPSFIPPSLSPIKSIPDDIVEDVAPKANYERKAVNRPDLITVADTRKWIDTITEENYLPKRFLPLAFMIQARHAFRMRKKF